MKTSSEKKMTLSGHLRELRNRLVVCIVCLIVSFMVGLHFAPDIVEMLTVIGEEYGYTYVFIAPQELLMQYFSVALIASICVMFPVIFYQVWAFVRPGLRRNENLLFVCALFCGLIFFVIGVIFAYKIMMPFMLYFFMDLSEGSNIAAAISVQNYLNFIFSLFIIFGLVFELPVVTVLLTQLGLLKTQWMKKGRRIVIVGIFLLAAIITPPDIVSQIMVAIPILILYEMSIWICTGLMKIRRRYAQKKEKEEE